MLLKTWVISALAAAAAAAPTAGTPNPNVFTAASAHSGNSDVHLQGINANGQKFSTKRPTSAYCPSVQGLDCSKTGDSTIFVFNPSGGTLSLNVQVPGGQRVYIASDGSLSYTIVHSASIPRDSFTSGFGYTPQATADTIGRLKFNDGMFMACPADDEVYQVYARNARGFTRADCVGINIGTSEYNGAPAWEYD